MKREASSTYHTLKIFSSIKYRLILEGIAVGVLAGLVSVLYRIVLEGAQEGLHLALAFGKAHPWAIPVWFAVLAALAYLVYLLVKAEPMIGGSGIPQVEGEVHGQIKQCWWRVLLCKFAGGALSLFAGLSLGREGPSIQLGAMAGKGFSRLTGRGRTEENFLITCGASAGLAAAFNAPFAGVLFSLEELHKNFSLEVLLSAMSASVAADFVSKNVFGLRPVFSFQVNAMMPLGSYWLIVILGVVLGLFGALYNWCTLKSQDLYAKIKAPYLRLLPAFFAAGALGFTMPEVLGGGHSLVGMLTDAQFLFSSVCVLFTVKFLFSMVSFGSGAPGGIFLPLLVMGALLGGIFGSGAIDALALDASLMPNFIILAMAGFFAAIVRAPITGIILISEMTGSFTHLLSLSLVSVIAYVTADLLRAKPIYEQLLERLVARQEDRVPQAGPTVNTSKILLEFPVHTGSVGAGKRLCELTLPEGCLVVAIRRQAREITPNGASRLQAGDTVLALVGEDSAAEADACLTGLLQTFHNS